MGPPDVERLENRLVLAAGPEDVLTKALRQELLAGLDLPIKASLGYKLRTNNLSGFDQQLLDFMRSRTSAGFFFDPRKVNDYAAYINTHLDTGQVLYRADSVMANLYPEQDGSQTFTVLAPEDVDWDCTTYSSNPETIHTLNRHYVWVDLAMAYRLSGDASYAQKLIGQLADWSAENPPLADPATWRRQKPRWWRLDTAVRAETWGWTYFLMLGSPAWTKEANTLFLVKMLEHGQFLNATRPTALESNQTLVHGQAMLYIGQLFPELGEACTWETTGRDLLLRSMDAQFYADGGHVEQSPNYAAVVLDRLLETRLLDQLNGRSWPASALERLSAGIESYYQMLSPDGTLPAIGDTYRTQFPRMFLKANIVQGVDRWPAAKPRSRDAWLLGPDAVDPFLHYPLESLPDERGRTYAMPESGTYIMRSDMGVDGTQIIFDAGPKGGGHGHADLLSFELFGGGRPLVADPGPYMYNTSAQRKWIISTPAHSTISIGASSHGALEGRDNPGIVVDQWEVADDYVQITAHHFGYAYMPGRPVVARSIWYDYDSTMLIVDWVKGVESNDIRTSFLLPTTSASRNLADGWIRSTNPSGGNVNIQSLLLPGQKATYRTTSIFTSSSPPPDHFDPATQFFTYQTASFACFATLITAYDGTTPPDVSARWLTVPQPGQKVQIRLGFDGADFDVSFTPPPLVQPDANATTRGSHNDLAYDKSGRLHLVFFDRDDRHLKYTVRSTNGQWSIIETIDAGQSCGLNPSIAIDSKGRVGIAYTDANKADLKYAFHNGSEWRVQMLDSRGSTGHYPSLAFSRNDGPVITYYDKSKGDLRMASSVTGGWSLSTIDSGSVGGKDVGRFSRLALDPSRPDASKWAIAYEDSSARQYRYAIQGRIPGGVQLASGYTLFTIADAPMLGGYISLAFDSASCPAVSFYDSSITGLRLARSSGGTFGGVSFLTQTVAAKGAVGYYSNLYFDSADRPAIFYFDRTRGKAMQAVLSSRRWAFTALATGGREIHVARYGSALAFTNLDESVPKLEVLLL